MALTDIEWTEATWNPVAGCSIVSPGCTNCYAMRMASRLQAMGKSKYYGTTRKSGGRAVWTGKVNLDPKTLEAPLKRKKPQLIFVNSMSDLFHEGVPEEFILQVWQVMEKASWHTFQVLTKRPERMRKILSQSDFNVLPNVWIGTSVESQDYVHRIDELRAISGHIKFISFEPLLSGISSPNLSGIDWAIVGGESGPKARPIEREWVNRIHKACKKHGTAFFFKQWGGTRKKKTGRIFKGQVWNEYPTTQLVGA